MLRSCAKLSGQGRQECVLRGVHRQRVRPVRMARLLSTPSLGARSNAQVARLRYCLVPCVTRTSVPIRLMSGNSIFRHVTIQNIRTFWPQIVAGTGAFVVIYGVSVLVYDLTATLVNISFEQVFYTGFFVGAGGVVLLGGAALYGYRAVTLSPNQVFRAAMYKLQRSDVVRAKLGPHVRAGQLKAFTTVPGHLSLAGGALPRLVAPHTQMLFQVVGEWGEGMVTAEALKHRGVLKFNVLALDTLARSGVPASLVLVSGTEEGLHVRGTLRGFLQAERAAYIPQDRAARDEDWIKQQEDLPAEPEVEVPDAELGIAPNGGAPVTHKHNEGKMQ